MHHKSEVLMCALTMTVVRGLSLSLSLSRQRTCAAPLSLSLSPWSAAREMHTAEPGDTHTEVGPWGYLRRHHTDEVMCVECGEAAGFCPSFWIAESEVISTMPGETVSALFCPCLCLFWCTSCGPEWMGAAFCVSLRLCPCLYLHNMHTCIQARRESNFIIYLCPPPDPQIGPPPYVPCTHSKPKPLSIPAPNSPETDLKRPSATSVWGLKLLVYEAFSY
jgi:hypothetical protein